MSEVTVCVPYVRSDEWRHRLFEFVVRRWESQFPSWRVSVGGGTGLNRARARNLAAEGVRSGVLVFCDADTTFADPSDIEEAVSVAAKQWVLPDRYVQTPLDWTQLALNGPPVGVLGVPEVPELDLGDSPGGIQVISAKQFRFVHGFDAGFTGWGYEDTAFRTYTDVICGSHARIGTALHLWHERPYDQFFGQPRIKENKARWKSYVSATSGGPSVMRKKRVWMERSAPK